MQKNIKINSIDDYIMYRAIQRILKKLQTKDSLIVPNEEPPEQDFFDGKEKHFIG